MSRLRLILKYWVPVLLWLIVIFSASSDPHSFARSSRLLGPLLHWLFPHMTEPTRNELVTLARKCAHLTEYAVLALLFWRALRKPFRGDTRQWSWTQALWSVLFVAVYAATDEFHQLFVPGRGASVHDVVIDTVGACLGMLVLWAVAFKCRRREPSR